jgi:hypothetical protein
MIIPDNAPNEKQYWIFPSPPHPKCWFCPFSFMFFAIENRTPLRSLFQPFCSVFQKRRTGRQNFQNNLKARGSMSQEMILKRGHNQPTAPNHSPKGSSSSIGGQHTRSSMPDRGKFGWMKPKYLALLLPLFASVALAKDGGEQHIRPAEVRPDAKIFRWPEHTAGDCHMANGTLVIRPNGSASFDADMWTHTHGTDYWHSTIRLLGQGRELGNSGRRDSPGIGHPQDGPGHITHWHYDFGFDGRNFPAIDEATEHGDC